MSFRKAIGPCVMEDTHQWAEVLNDNPYYCIVILAMWWKVLFVEDETKIWTFNCIPYSMHTYVINWSWNQRLVLVHAPHGLPTVYIHLQIINRSWNQDPHWQIALANSIMTHFYCYSGKTIDRWKQENIVEPTHHQRVLSAMSAYFCMAFNEHTCMALYLLLNCTLPLSLSVLISTPYLVIV